MNRIQPLFVLRNKNNECYDRIYHLDYRCNTDNKAAMEMWQWKDIAAEKKIVAIILIILTSWIGLAVYYFWGKENLPQMLK